MQKYINVRVIAVFAAVFFFLGMKADGKKSPTKTEGKPIALGVPLFKTYALYKADYTMSAWTVTGRGLYEVCSDNKVYLFDQETGRKRLLIEGYEGVKSCRRRIEAIDNVGEHIILTLGYAYDSMDDETEYDSNYATWDGVDPNSIHPIPGAITMYDIGESQTYIWFSDKDDRCFRYNVVTGSRQYYGDEEHPGCIGGYMTAEGMYLGFGNVDSESDALSSLKFWIFDDRNASEVDIPNIKKVGNYLPIHSPVCNKLYIGHHRSIYQYPYDPIVERWECLSMPSNCPGEISDFVYNVKTGEFLTIIDNTIDGEEWENFWYMLLFKPSKNTAMKDVVPLPYEMQFPTNEEFTIDTSYLLHGITVDVHGNYFIGSTGGGHFIVYNPYGVVGYREGVNKNPQK